MILVAGAGAVGASIACQLAELGAHEVVLCERERVGSGSSGRALGGLRHQFTTGEDVALARETIAFVAALPASQFERVGYLFLATSEAGRVELERRRELQLRLGVPVEQVGAELVPGLEGGDVTGAVFCALDGVANPYATTCALVERAAALGVELRERCDAASLAAAADTVVVACGAWSAELGRRLGVELPVTPLRRQLLATAPLHGLPSGLPMVIELESGFHFRRRGEALVLAMSDPAPHYGFDLDVDASLVDDRLARLAHRFPAAAGAVVAESWAGLYDMTPDARPIIGRVADGVYAACGFSGHGFMQSVAVGRALAQEILEGGCELDLAPFRLERFATGASLSPADVL